MTIVSDKSVVFDEYTEEWTFSRQFDLSWWWWGWFKSERVTTEESVLQTFPSRISTSVFPLIVPPFQEEIHLTLVWSSRLDHAWDADDLRRHEVCGWESKLQELRKRLPNDPATFQCTFAFTFTMRRVLTKGILPQDTLQSVSFYFHFTQSAFIILDILDFSCFWWNIEWVVIILINLMIRKVQRKRERRVRFLGSMIRSMSWHDSHDAMSLCDLTSTSSEISSRKCYQTAQLVWTSSLSFRKNRITKDKRKTRNFLDRKYRDDCHDSLETSWLLSWQV
jgi:hypothetical protein